jgi:hypothetical protein
MATVLCSQYQRYVCLFHSEQDFASKLLSLWREELLPVKVNKKMQKNKMIFEELRNYNTGVKKSRRRLSNTSENMIIINH